MRVENDVSQRGSWYLLTGVVTGLVLGLIYAWVISPVKYVDTVPASLSAEDKDRYRSLIASAYVVTGDLGRAQSRLALLADPDLIQALLDQSQRVPESDDPFSSPAALISLAEALKQLPTSSASATPFIVTSVTLESTAPSTSSTATHRSTDSLELTDTPTLHPIQTPTASLGASFVLVSRENVCDAHLRGGLMQVVVNNSAGQPASGVEIFVYWEDGQEHFFTGLKPELGNGYADFVMTPGVFYTLQPAASSAPLSGLITPSCQAANGDSYWGGLRLVYQQP